MLVTVLTNIGGEVADRRSSTDLAMPKFSPLSLGSRYSALGQIQTAQFSKSDHLGIGDGVIRALNLAGGAMNSEDETRAGFVASGSELIAGPSTYLNRVQNAVMPEIDYPS